MGITMGNSLPKSPEHSHARDAAGLHAHRSVTSELLSISPLHSQPPEAV